MVILSFYAQNCLSKWAGEKFLFHCSARFSWILIWWINADFDADFKNGLISHRICSVLPQNRIIIFIFFTKTSQKRRNLVFYEWIIEKLQLWIYIEYHIKKNSLRFTLLLLFLCIYNIFVVLSSFSPHKLYFANKKL